jgi:hypothetical protein
LSDFISLYFISFHLFHFILLAALTVALAAPVVIGMIVLEVPELRLAGHQGPAVADEAEQDESHTGIVAGS